MPDTQALLRLVDELIWTLRRQGFVVAPTQAIELLRAVRIVGWDDATVLRDTTAALVLKNGRDQPRFERVFSEFFARTQARDDLWARLRAQGFGDDEVDPLRLLLETLARGAEGGASFARLGALLEGGFELDQLLQLSGVRRELDALRSPLQLGFFAQKAANAVGLGEARVRLAALRQHLRGALGARGDALADALARELDRAGDSLRDELQAALSRRQDAENPSGARQATDLPFTSLSDVELDDVRRAVRGFAQRLRGAARVRARRSRRGRIHPSGTMRTLARTGGVPFQPVRRRRRRDKPRLMLLCDVSESVRTVSRFMLELVYAAHDLFDHTRSFVFVSELGETTELFERQTPRVALASAYGGDVVPVTDNSNYGRVLRSFEARYARAVDRRTTVVILGDGRTNYHDAAEDTLVRLRGRARALYWFCSEPRTGWSTGDSAMPRYAPKCTKVFEVTSARELEEATRTLLWRR